MTKLRIVAQLRATLMAKECLLATGQRTSLGSSLLALATPAPLVPRRWRRRWLRPPSQPECSNSHPDQGHKGHEKDPDGRIHRVFRLWRRCWLCWARR